MNYQIIKEMTYTLGSIPTTSGVVIANITVDTHLSNSTADQAIHHLYPEALMSGAGSYTREQFLDAINHLGASIAISITNGRLTITLTATSHVYPKLLNLLETMLTSPTFTNLELARTKRVIGNQLHTRKENSAFIAQEQFCNALYKKTDRRHKAAPETILETFNLLTRKDLKQFHNEILTLDWTCTILATPTEINSFIRLIEVFKGKQEQKNVIRVGGQVVPKKKLYLKKIPSRSNVDFSIGASVPITITHPDYTPLTFALGILAIPGFAGRLMNTVRNKEGLTYSIYGYLETFSNYEPGHIRIATFFSPQQTPQGLTSTFRELSNFYDHGITTTEYKRFRTIFSTKQTILNDSLKRQLSELHTFVLLDFSVEEIANFKESLVTVSKKQVDDAIKKYFNPDAFILSGAGPVNKIDCSNSELLAKLKK